MKIKFLTILAAFAALLFSCSPDVPELPEKEGTEQGEDKPVIDDGEDPETDDPDEGDQGQSRTLRVGVLGDSISTFEGWLYSSETSAMWYPTMCTNPVSGCAMVDSVEKTYWWKVIYAKCDDAVLDVNSSWQGTKVGNGSQNFISRCGQFTDPDVIMIHGGTNDKNQSTALGNYDYTRPAEYLDQTAFRPAFIKLLKTVKKNYPGVHLVVIVGDMLRNTDYGPSVIEICRHYGVTYVDFTDAALPKQQGSHPDATGHQTMADRIWSVAQAEFREKDASGDHVFFDGEVVPEIHELKGEGTSQSPYLLSDADDLCLMGQYMKSGSSVHFRMTADIDMKDVQWTPLNSTNPYDQAINLNGDGHKISNMTLAGSGWLGFFAVLNGTVSNLTFENASVTGTGSCIGVVGAWSGANNGVSGNCENVHITGATVTNSGNSEAGGFFGKAGYSTMTGCSCSASVTAKSAAAGGLVGNASHTMCFDRCRFDGSVKTNRYCGGIVGVLNNANESNISSIKNCCTTGSVNAGQQVGGIAGDIYANIQVTNCWTSMSVTGQFGIGGIVGRASGAKASGTGTPNNTIKGCIAWNGQVSCTTSGQSDKYSSAAIVGFTSVYNTLSDCWRRCDLQFNECNSFNVLFDQEDSSASSPLSVDASTYVYNYPYHGKAAPSGSTASSLAQALGWDPAIWDFSGQCPALVKIQ